MIYAKHKKWADWIFQHYLNRLFKRHFYSLTLLPPLPTFNLEKPLLLLPNHSSWWDGFFIYLLNKKVLHRKAYLMMLEEQLQQNRFFRFLGAYSIKSDTFKGVKHSLQYTINLLNRRDEPLLVCFFPQGELQCWDKRPILFRRGLEFLLKSITREIDLCFLGIRIEFLKEQRPEVFMQFSPIREINHSCYSMKDLELEFNPFLDQLEKKIVEGEKGEMIFQGKKSVNEWFHQYWKRGR
jgi:hypothetical protein